MNANPIMEQNVKRNGVNVAFVCTRVQRCTHVPAVHFSVNLAGGEPSAVSGKPTAQTVFATLQTKSKQGGPTPNKQLARVKQQARPGP
jgi:hypothetical protein